MEQLPHHSLVSYFLVVWIRHAAKAPSRAECLLLILCALKQAPKRMKNLFRGSIDQWRTVIWRATRQDSSKSGLKSRSRVRNCFTTSFCLEGHVLCTWRIFVNLVKMTCPLSSTLNYSVSIRLTSSASTAWWSHLRRGLCRRANWTESRDVYTGSHTVSFN